MVSGKGDSGFYTASYTKPGIYALLCVFVLEDVKMIEVSRRKYSLRNVNTSVHPNTDTGTRLCLLQIMNNKREGYCVR
jgi:hypothetical protein